MEISVEPGKTYAVTTSGSCTVTDADGLKLCTASSGSQSFFVATTPVVNVSDNKAKVSRANFSCALARQSAGGGATADGLPARYTRVEYLESTGTQYIDTGYYLSNKDDIRLDVAEVERPQFWGSSFGTWYDSGASYYVALKYYDDNARFVAKCGPSNSYGTWETLNSQPRDRNVFECKNRKWTFNGVSFGKVDYGGFTLTNPASLFCLNNKGNAGWNPSKLRVYELKVSQSEDLKLHFIPVVNSDGVACMYDTVSKRSFLSVSGKFIAGISSLSALSNVLLNLPHRETAGSVLTVHLPESVDMTEARRIADLAGGMKNWQISII